MRLLACFNGYVTKVEVVMHPGSCMKEYCLLISTAILKHHTSIVFNCRESVENLGFVIHRRRNGYVVNKLPRRVPVTYREQEVGVI